MHEQFLKLAKQQWKPNDKPAPEIADAKHLSMMEAIAPYAKPTVQKNVTNVDISYATRKTKVLFILMPEWAPEFPPFNLARLTAVAKKAGYQTNALDLNIKSYRFLKNTHPNNPNLDFWEGTREWKWLSNNYYTEIHPYLETFFQQHLQNIVKQAPDVVGFTVYYCNQEPVRWMIRQLRKALPNVKIIAGGSNAHNEFNTMINDSIYDYVCSGEGEKILLEILDEIENGATHPGTQLRTPPEEQRINISNLPLPDYSDFDFNEYKFPNGVCSELSRGCTAKCTFCEETHFWKYRQRQATDILTEVEHLYYNYGTDVFWFLDSLVNGNVNELRAFCKGVIAKDLKIHWTGYARCDGRMDREFYEDLAKSGCVTLNYGIESGSQATLDAMAKGVTIKEMEQNLQDGLDTGVMAMTNWMVGFPTETYQDFADTMTFLWRNKDRGIINISAGFGFGLGAASIVGQNNDKYNVLGYQYLGQWMTKDFRLSKMHVLMRMKMFAIFLQNVVFQTPYHVVTPYRPNLPRSHYQIEFNDPSVVKQVTYEKFDYNIAQPGIGPFADSLFNEMFVLWRILWRTRGGFKATVIFDEDLDIKEWGERNSGPMWAEHTFEITDEGKWQARSWIKFKQPPAVLEGDVRGPFFSMEFSRYQNSTAKRARVFAKPKWGDQGRSDPEFWQLLKDERILNQCVDFTFDHVWQGQGDWSDHEKYQVEVPGGESWRMSKNKIQITKE